MALQAVVVGAAKALKAAANSKALRAAQSKKARDGRNVLEGRNPIAGPMQLIGYAILGVFGLLTLVVVVVIAPIYMFTTMFSSPFGGGITGTPIPPVYWPMYTAAAAYYKVNPYLLASIHFQESTFSRNPAVLSGANAYHAMGPMEFLEDTWPAYERAFWPIRDKRPDSYPLDRRKLPSCASISETKGCPYDDFDSIAAAAKMLSADANESLYSAGTHQAVCNYIGSCTEVDHCTGSVNEYCHVIPRAKEWELEGAAVVSGPRGGPIVTIAEEELAKGFHEVRGNNCNPYGEGICEQWCAMFATWVWKKAGIFIRDKMYDEDLRPYWVPDLEAYAERHGLWRHSPVPGAMILFETHVGLVERVLPDGQIYEIGGNQSNAVTRVIGPPSAVLGREPNGYMIPPEPSKGSK